jgi:hypothetical protein
MSNATGRSSLCLELRHERLLDRMQSCVGDAFDRRQRFPRSGAGRQQATHHRRAIEQHCAGAADARAADELGAGEVQAVANHIDQERFGIVRKCCGAAVDRHGAHFRTPVLRLNSFTRCVAGGAIAPAISMRSMTATCFRNASTGCIDG